jgi:carboxypeptidase C (cathepsin A)
MANLKHADRIEYPGHERFKDMALQSYKVNGTTKGEFKSLGNLSYLRVFEAGHMLNAYRKFPFVAVCTR